MRGAESVRVRVLLILLLSWLSFARAQSAEQASNIECIQRLEMPLYPELMRQGRFHGTQVIKVLVSGDGLARLIDSSFRGAPVITEKEFASAAERAVRESHFKACAGKTVTLIFHYELGDPDTGNSPYAFSPPNHFWIRAGSVVANPGWAPK